MKSDQIASKFKAGLAEAAQQLDFVVSTTQFSTNVLQISGGLSGLIDFHVVGGKQHRWGVTKNNLDRLSATEARWAVVFLYESPFTGYFFDARAVSESIGSGVWRSGHGRNEGQYKVWSGASLDLGISFESLDQLVRLLVATLARRNRRNRPVAAVRRRVAPMVGPQELIRNEEERRRTGERGERHVFDLERARLKRVGKANLASKVRLIAREDVNAGYDVWSFSPDGRDKFIEVKAAKGKLNNFEITANEVATAMRMGDAYWLYLVANLDTAPVIKCFRNPSKYFGTEISLEPSVYQATLL